MLRIAIVAAVYASTGWLGLALAIPPGYATAVWPPSGIALAAVLIWGPRVWPGIWLGSFVVNLGVSLKAPGAEPGLQGLTVAASIAVGSTLQALLGAGLIGRWIGTDRLLQQASTVFAFTGITALSCVVAPTWGVTTLWSAGMVQAVGYSASWRTWWLGDLVGIVVITPLLLSWYRTPADDGHRRPRLAETVGSWVLLLLISLSVFIGPLALLSSQYPLAFLPVPCLVWMAYRFDVTHVTLATLLLCGIAVFATSHGSGPFVRETTDASLFLLQAFSGLATLTGLALATAVAAQRTAEHDLHTSQEQLQLFIAHAPAAIAMFDRQMRYIAASHRWSNDYGLNGRDLHGQCHYAMFPDMPGHWRDVHQRGLAGEVVTTDEDRFERPDGVVQWLRWEVRPWYADGTPAGIIILTEDVTERVKAREELLRLNSELEQRVQERTAQLTELAQQFEEQSLTDTLTGLANRRSLERRLDLEICSAARYETALSLLMADVDHFKDYNDAFGHLAGDAILRGIGLLLRESARHTDLAARYGGEEFILLLVHADPDEALALAERIRRKVEATSWPHRPVTISIGVATLAPGRSDAAGFIADADRALYEAKRRGRNCVTHAHDASLPDSARTGGA